MSRITYFLWLYRWHSANQPRITSLLRALREAAAPTPF